MGLTEHAQLKTETYTERNCPTGKCSACSSSSLVLLVFSLLFLREPLSLSVSLSLFLCLLISCTIISYTYLLLLLFLRRNRSRRRTLFRGVAAVPTAFHFGRRSCCRDRMAFYDIDAILMEEEKVRLLPLPPLPIAANVSAHLSLAVCLSLTLLVMFSLGRFFPSVLLFLPGTLHNISLSLCLFLFLCGVVHRHRSRALLLFREATWVKIIVGHCDENGGGAVKAEKRPLGRWSDAVLGRVISLF